MTEAGRLRYAVVGARGQLGQEFAKHLPPERMIALDSEMIDVADRESVRAALSGLDCDGIINLAAFHDVNGSEENPGKAFSVNTLGGFHVASIAAEMRKKVVFLSSDYVFGGDVHRETPYVEADPVAPLNLYGASKVAGELMVRAALPENHLIIRSSSLFGCVTSKKGWTFPEMMLARARDGQKLQVVGDQTMAPTYTCDLARRVLELLDVNASGTFHVANAGKCSWHDLACATFELVGIETHVEPVSSDAFAAKARRPRYSVLGTARLEAVGLPPLRPWRSALEAYLIEKGEIEHG